MSLPPAVYEAARVDGASGWLVLRRITLPMLKEVIAIAFIIRFMDAIKHRQMSFRADLSWSQP